MMQVRAERDEVLALCETEAGLSREWVEAVETGAEVLIKVSCIASLNIGLLVSQFV